MAKKDNQYSTADSVKAYKCEEIKSVFNPNSEWFGTLNHTCAYRGEREKIYTLDTVSPPTNLSACADQATCLAGGTEYSLTPTNFAKGVQRIPTDFVSTVQNSLNAGADTDVKNARMVFASLTPLGITLFLSRFRRHHILAIVEEQLRMKQ